jgi:hypothetical protein
MSTQLVNGFYRCSIRLTATAGEAHLRTKHFRSKWFRDHQMYLVMSVLIITFS